MRSRVFKNLLFQERRSFRKRSTSRPSSRFPLALGVWVRSNVHNFYAADVAFEASILIGLIGGRYAGVLWGAVLATPAALHGEYLTLPFYVVVGFVSGLCRDMAKNPEEIWSFSPFMDLSIYRWLQRAARHPLRKDWQILFFMLIVMLQVDPYADRSRAAGADIQFDSPRPLVELAIFASVVACVAVPLKVWNVTRIELKLEEQERLLLQARLDALQSQINPHFLFNTLNSVSSLVRFQPETARELILKLSTILRALLSRHDAFRTATR